MHIKAHPRDTVSYESFLTTTAPAVALDGYVAGPTRWDQVGHFNFNHHDGTDRFTTRATCEQVALALRSGALLGDPEMSVHVNDDDPDVALAVWLLQHPDLVDVPAVRLLCATQGALDTCAGATAVPARQELEQLAWIIDPWARTRNELHRDAASMEAVLEAVGQRISAHVAGAGSSMDLTEGYDVLDQRNGVWAVVEHHPLARAALCTAGARVYVAVREQAGHDVMFRAVTIGRASPFVRCDLVGVWAVLNDLEHCHETDMWGGGDLVGGAPRATGTHLELSTIMDVVVAKLG